MIGTIDEAKKEVKEETKKPDEQKVTPKPKAVASNAS